jgi:hypothetical protein
VRLPSTWKFFDTRAGEILRNHRITLGSEPRSNWDYVSRYGDSGDAT